MISYTMRSFMPTLITNYLLLILHQLRIILDELVVIVQKQQQPEASTDETNDNGVDMNAHSDNNNDNNNDGDDNANDMSLRRLGIPLLYRHVSGRRQPSFELRSDVSSNNKDKRFDVFKRGLKHCSDETIMELYRNSNSKLRNELFLGFIFELRAECPSLNSIGTLCFDYCGLASPIHVLVWEAVDGKREWSDVEIVLERMPRPLVRYMLCAQNGFENKTPLHLASEEAPILKEMIRMEPEAAKLQDKQGWLPLHYAVSSENFDAVKMLVTVYPPSIETKNNQMFTPLDLAFKAGNDILLALSFGALKQYCSETFHNIGSQIKADNNVYVTNPLSIILMDIFEQKRHANEFDALIKELFSQPFWLKILCDHEKDTENSENSIHSLITKNVQYSGLMLSKIKYAALGDERKFDENEAFHNIVFEIFGEPSIIISHLMYYLDEYERLV